MTLSTILPFVNKPGRYIGREYNSTVKDWQQTAIHVALAFPDLYEIGMSHQGLQILYHLINGHKNFLAERCYCPDRDAEELHNKTGTPLVTLESGTPVRDFEIFAITLPYELCYTNIVTLLQTAKIPLYQRNRDETAPIVLGGGSCAFNPEPVADFFDAILLGDGEESVPAVAETLKRAKEEDLSRAETLLRIAEIEGIYVPSHFAVRYDTAGKVTKISKIAGNKKSVRRCILPRLDQTDHLLHPLVANAKIVHDRLGIEIARGCTRGCRFCQAGIIYRPVRERTVDQIMELAQTGIANTGFEELALLSLSTGDYSCINDLLPKIMNRFEKRYVSVSMPSMRVGTLTQEVMEQIKRVRKTGFTVAPEAGSERMRQVINKGITEEALLETCTEAFTLGWNAIKMYFMIGLPTETDEDVAAIIHLAEKIVYETRGIGGRGRQITVSVGTYVPKPHTPFQWEEQVTIEESRRRISILRRTLTRKNIKLKYHDPEVSFLEGVFSRGDRRLSRVIEAAWKKGARLDAWGDHFSLQPWFDAAEELQIDFAAYLREREDDEILPWSHLDCGVDIAFLKRERTRANELSYTPDCRYHGCQQCGLCDFKTVMPQVISRKQEPARQNTEPVTEYRPAAKPGTGHFKYMVNYSRLGDISFLGHLEILQLIFRALRRAGIATNFSQGFNPTPKVSFGNALSVGIESDAEYFIMDLPAPLHSVSETQDILNNALPRGLTVREITRHSGIVPASVLTSYTITMPEPLDAEKINAVNTYRQSRLFPIAKTRKGKTKEIDIRPLVNFYEPQTGETSLRAELITTSGEPGVKIQEALSGVLGLAPEKIHLCRIRKTAWKQL